MAFFHGFETKDWNDWVTLNSSPDYTVDSTYAFEGTNSGRIDSISGTGINRYQGPFQRLNFSEDYDTLEFYFRETSNNFAFLLRAENAFGDRIFGVGSDNPQWDYESPGEISELYPGDGYNRWVRVKVALNGDGTFTAEFEDQQTQTFRSVTADNINSGPIRSLTLTSQPKYDDDGGQFLDVWFDSIELSKSNSPPNASLIVTNSDDDLDVTADASGSSDPDGDPLSYDYDWGDGTTDTNTESGVTHTYSSAGTYTITVTVTDTLNASDAASDTVTVDLDDVQVNDGGTWKNADDIYVNNGGTWQECKQVYVNDGGTWKKVYDDPTV